MSFCSSDKTKIQRVFLSDPSRSPTIETTWIICNELEECQDTTQQCQDGIYCNILCIDSYATCQRATFICPSNAPCSIHCGDEDVCRNMNVNALGSTSLNLTCNGDTTSQCSDVNVKCPINGDCYIQCAGDHVCLSMDIDASKTNSHDLTIDLVNKQSYSTLKESNINCPNNGVCTINIDGIDNALESTAITATSSTLLIMNASGSNVLLEATIYCPKSNLTENCIINVPYNSKHAFTPPLSSVRLYASRAFDSISIICNYVQSVDEC